MLLSNALVTLQRRILAAGMALEYGELSASTDNGIAVTFRAAPSPLGCGIAVIFTLRVLAEVDLDPAVLRWDPRLGIFGRFFLQGTIPLSSIR